MNIEKIKPSKTKTYKTEPNIFEKHNYEAQLALGMKYKIAPRQFLEFLYFDEYAQIDADNSFNISKSVFVSIKTRLCEARHNKSDEASCILAMEHDTVHFACREIFRNNQLHIQKIFGEIDKNSFLPTHISCILNYEILFQETIGLAKSNINLIPLLVNILENYANLVKYSVEILNQPPASDQRLTYKDESESRAL